MAGRADLAAGPLVNYHYIYIIGILQPQTPPIRESFSKFFKVDVSRLIVRVYASRGGRPSLKSFTGDGLRS